MKIKAILFSMVVFIMAFNIGCATSGESFKPIQISRKNAVVYFYRPGAFVLSRRTIFMGFPNDKRSYPMTNKGYYPLVVKPGKYTIVAAGTDARPVYYTIKVKRGQERYVKVTFANTLSLGVPAEFAEVSKKEGKNQIVECFLITAK